MLQESGVRLISERDYSVGDCRAHSLVVGLKTEFQRIRFLSHQTRFAFVMYLSPRKPALNDLVQNPLESISVKPKTATTTNNLTNRCSHGSKESRIRN